MRKVRLLRRAQADLESIERYLLTEAGSSVAARTVDRLLDVIETLEDHAERAATPRDERLRGLGFRYLVRRPYLVFFRIQPREVRVHRVVHGHRKYAGMI